MYLSVGKYFSAQVCMFIFQMWTTLQVYIVCMSQDISHYIPFEDKKEDTSQYFSKRGNHCLLKGFYSTCLFEW